MMRACLALAGALSMAAPGPSPAAVDAALEREAVEMIVREYLITNPEVIREALEELERRQTAEAEARRRDAIASRSDELLGGDDAIVLGNPDGDVTMVEFFDYNCSFCKRAHGDLERLIGSDPQLRVVMKEWPFLSAESLAAAKVSLAVAKQGRYEDFHGALLTGNGIADEERALQIAEAMGYDMDRIRTDKDSPDVLSTLEETMLLADAIGVTGTPAYVIGDNLILGAQGYATLKKTIEDVRAETCKTC